MKGTSARIRSWKICAAAPSSRKCRSQPVVTTTTTTSKASSENTTGTTAAMRLSPCRFIRHITALVAASGISLRPASMRVNSKAPSRQSALTT